MPTVETVGAWIASNVLDSQAWDEAAKKDLAFVQASRNLTRWYPEVPLTDETVAYQAIWELQGLDPALKFQKQGVKAVTDNGERIDYTSRDKVAPEVREILGPPIFEVVEHEAEEEALPQFGGMLL
ncbi:hypothetical protein KP77_25050 [Jeotgalibacillus alimentarius]|uniref:Uncharacterized protein n=1 Tax=Jeotgalibacillus alimentarius TaxID=135826 RepID=A0A0C2VR63_9BACL|nr:hypothetical protein [Jeotgalibacillus alimentarius]KIL46936.1 hypothetical protein KP77_25050 [Jeotgalibacillus alimentarius]